VIDVRTVQPYVHPTLRIPGHARGLATTMITQLLAIARNTFVESVRQPILYILVMASGLLQLFNVFLSMYSMGFGDSAEVSGDDKLLLDIGLATVLLCATLLAAFIATAVLSREIEDKTALTVISKPVGRPLFVLSKYLGVAGAMLTATAVMLLFFLFAIRHGVMSRAFDDPHIPVIVFVFGSLAIATGVAVWGNFFYGWVFSSTAITILLPLLAVGYVASLFLTHNWRMQPPTTDLTPQVLMACAGVAMAMLVLTAVAVAASTRLGQVMTILVCMGVFLFGLLSNHFVGRHAFVNYPVQQIAEAEAVSDRDGDFRDAGDTWRLTLRGELRDELSPGDALHYATNPGGIAMLTPTQRSLEGDPTRERDVFSPESGPAVVVLATPSARELTIVNVGGANVRRPPRAEDYIFTAPTRTNAAARVAWSVTPNMQFFWLVDAVTQAHPIPPRYMLMMTGYGAAQIAALLALAVILFQRREVG